MRANSDQLCYTRINISFNVLSWKEMINGIYADLIVTWQS